VNNIFLIVNEKNLSSGEIQEKKCQPIAKTRVQTDCLLISSDVSTTLNLSSDVVVVNGEQKPIDNKGLASLLRRVLNKLANSREYNGIVTDLHAFVNVFNERTSEYKLQLGLQAVLYNTEKQKARFWK
jgi:hypothetical protein